MKNIFAILLLCSTIVCCACGSEDEKEMITPVLEVGSKNVYVGESAVTREISITPMWNGPLLWLPKVKLGATLICSRTGF